MTRADSAYCRKLLWLDGWLYRVRVLQQISQPVDAPRLLIVSYLPNEQAFQVLRVCVQAIQRFTPEPHEIWVIDNHSPPEQAERIADLKDINIVLSETEPRPLGTRFRRIKSKQIEWGSYANAIGLEIGVRVINKSSQLVMTMHMDTMPCHAGWLTYLRGKLNQQVRASGVRLDRARVENGVLHVLGMLIDFQIFRALKLNFYPELPDLDVGDRVTVNLRKNGFEIAYCVNSIWEGEILDALPENSPFRQFHVDRAFDNKFNIIHLHLGRGIHKSSYIIDKKVSAEEWVKFADDYLLASSYVFR